MLSISFLGAAGTVTGSSFFISEPGGHGVLVDMGMFQGTEEIEAMNHIPWNLASERIDAVLLTHAHLDHCGRLPLLIKHQFHKPIYMTSATKELLGLVLRDAAKIGEFNKRETGVEPLYGVDEVEQVLRLVRVVEYGQKFKVNNFDVIFRDAGHILGSASIELAYDKQRIVFSGDLGNSPQVIEKPTSFIDEADVVVMESTYGGKTHPVQDARDVIAQEINEIEKSGGTMLIPAFSLERTQVLLHMLDHLKRDGLIQSETKVYLDSPMGIETTAVYRRFSSLFSKHMQEHFRHDDPFDFPGLEVVPKGWQSKRIAFESGAKVIIAGSGMMTGGRIVHHAKNFLSDPATRLLIVGYQGEGTLGRELQEGAERVTIEGEEIEVMAQITEIHGMSAHADEPKLLDWLQHIHGVKQVFLIHGEDSARVPLANSITNRLGIKTVELPAHGDTMDLMNDK